MFYCFIELEEAKTQNKRSAQKCEELEGQNVAMKQNVQVLMSETDKMNSEVFECFYFVCMFYHIYFYQ